MLPVMLQLYNVREDLKKDFDGTLMQIAEMGYKYVELAIYAHTDTHIGESYGKTADEVKASLDKAGLKTVSAHVPIKGMLEDPESVISFHIDVGCKFIAIPSLRPEDFTPGPNYDGIKKTVSLLGEEVKKRGGLLLYHNHDFEFVDYNGKLILDDFYDSIPSDLLQAQMDTCWVRVGGVNPVEYLPKYSGRLPIVHLKDFDPSKGGTIKSEKELMEEAKKAKAAREFPFRAVGHGIQDIPAIIKASEQAGAKWLVVEQDIPTQGKTALECAKESLDYLNSL